MKPEKIIDKHRKCMKFNEIQGSRRRSRRAAGDVSQRHPGRRCRASRQGWSSQPALGWTSQGARPPPPAPQEPGALGPDPRLDPLHSCDFIGFPKVS